MKVFGEGFEKLSAHVGVLHGQTNVALIDNGDRVVVIDTGQSEGDAERLLKTAECVFGKSISLILNTHSHADHCGANDALIKKTGATVWAPQKESLIMQVPEIMSYMYWGGHPFTELEGEGFVCKNPLFTVERRLFANDVLHFAYTDVECILLEGHCFDQMGFLVTDREGGTKSFFVGDALFGMTMLKRYWIPFLLNPELFRKSVERIENTPADFFVPSHGDIYTQNTISEMNQVVTLETETLILKTLKKARLTQEELLEAVAGFAGLDLKMSQFILIGCTVRSYLSSLYARGLVTYSVEDNRMLWSLV